MSKQKIFIALAFQLFVICLVAQPTHPITDIDKRYKEAASLILKEDYAIAYPLLKELTDAYSENSKTNHAYINDDVLYSYILCELKLMLPIGEKEAAAYILNSNNQARKQMMSFHLAHYCFLNYNFNKAIEYFNLASYDNLNNDQIADAKFEKAYAYFNEKKFAAAKPLFNEIHQIPSNQYYLASNYYYGFISYYEKDYTEALKSFKLVENDEAYSQVVPYYIAEIYYAQGKNAEALNYAESLLSKGVKLYYEKNLQLLIGQLHFENHAYSKALPFIEYYVADTKEISNEILYELSYCYYATKNTSKAIEGFKQLSSSKDSMGQNSMYLLGGLYLDVNDKTSARNAFQFCAYNSSNATQQRISRFNYAKLSSELGFQDVALNEIKLYLSDYPHADNETEAKELLINLLANTNNFKDALDLYNSFGTPTVLMQKVYPRLLYGRAIEYINDQQLSPADTLLANITSSKQTGNIFYYAHFWRAEIAYRNQRFDEAIKFASIYLQGNPPSQGEANSIAAKYILGYSWFQKENYKNALPFFESIGKSSKTNSSLLEQDAFTRTADCYYMTKEFSKAAVLYDNVIANGLSQADYALYQKAMIVGLKNSSEKIKVLIGLPAQYPTSNLIIESQMEIAATYVADEKFSDAVPYLNAVISSDQAAGVKPKAYLKLGLAYYNNNDNKNALSTYKQLLQLYPQSAETDEALSIIKDIYVEDGKPDEYVDLMRASGINISISDADSLSYTAALLKYESGDCNAAIAGFSSYLSRYNNGAYSIESNYFAGVCAQKNKDLTNAVKYFEYVNNKGLSKYFEIATLELARIYYFELKDYSNSRKYFESLRLNVASQENRLESLRGLVRSYYQLKDYLIANEVAIELLSNKGIGTDDKAVGYLVLGKSQQMNNDCVSAIASFKSAALINKSAWGAEARYEIAHCYFSLNNYTASEKACMSVIKETGSYDFWVTKSYILLGDIFLKKKDYFNAKATYESVANNAAIVSLKDEAQQKFNQTVEMEKQ